LDTIFFAIASAILDLLAKAAAALPLVACLSMLAGRRGNGAFCLWGAQKLLYLALFLAWTGPLWLAAGYLAETMHFGGAWSQILAPLLSAPGLPWSSSCGVWLLGWLFVAVACATLGVLRANFQDGGYRAKVICLPLCFCLLAAFCFFAAFMLVNWPFAGLPEGMDWERASMAIFRNASRNYFMAFCPAGAVALLMLNLYAAKAGTDHVHVCARWLAFWACAGCLPYSIVTWGSLMGMGLNASVSIDQAFRPQTYGLVFLTGAMASWIFILCKPRLWRILSLAGFLLLLLKTLLPIIMGHAFIS